MSINDQKQAKKLSAFNILLIKHHFFNIPKSLNKWCFINIIFKANNFSDLNEYKKFQSVPYKNF